MKANSAPECREILNIKINSDCPSTKSKPRVWKKRIYIGELSKVIELSSPIRERRTCISAMFELTRRACVDID